MGADGFGGMSYYVGIFLGLMLILKWVLKSVNIWIYERNLEKKKRKCLPPGDMGWPFIGNMWSFLRAFKSNDPDAFISNFLRRFGSRGLYKSFMFGSPSIIVTVPEACRKVLFDDEAFQPGWPTATRELIGKKSFIGISYEDHKRLRKLTAAPVNGHEALSTYMQYIETNVVLALEKWSKMGRIEFLTYLRKLTFQIIMHIFLSTESEHVMDALEKEYTVLNYGVRAMAINIPGFAYYNALKARKNLVAILQTVVHERRKKREANEGMSKKDMLDALLDTTDEKGRKLDDEEIIDTLVMYLNAGHESSGHITMWSTILLQAHPEFFHIAKEEQERIVKNMPPTQEGLTLKEYRQMEYLSKVIDETLRLVTFSLMTFREAKKDVDIKGYFIPKGWKVLLWFRSVHHNPELYPQPKEFNPSRWDDLVPKPGTFLPFGAGSRLCPGNDLAKLEIAIFLHHFLLNYEFERENPECPIMYLPHSRPKDNCGMFHRSYLLMEKLFKIYIYKEGERPLFHTGPTTNIYSMEGLFLNSIENDPNFKVSNPDKAHVYFLPFSVVMILDTLFDPIIRDKAVLERVIGDYVHIVSSRYPYWNRSLGSDHFMLSCHDWGPRATWYVHSLYFTSIRLLCNANTSEYFNPRKDASIPEINLLRTETTTITGGLPPPNRTNLAFFAGGEFHGKIRPLLFQHWKDKDEDIQVYEKVPNNVSYLDTMKRTRFCICPSGFEVASPRIVEAIYAECVPVLISQNYVLPFSDVLNWDAFSVQVSLSEIPNLKKILLGISEDKYKKLQENVKKVQQHFLVNNPTKRYDVYHMILHSLWLRRLNLQIYS